MSVLAHRLVHRSVFPKCARNFGQIAILVFVKDMFPLNRLRSEMMPFRGGLRVVTVSVSGSLSESGSKQPGPPLDIDTDTGPDSDSEVID